MNEPRDSYWSIEACGWVRSPARGIDVPEPRPADGDELTDAIQTVDSSPDVSV